MDPLQQPLYPWQQQNHHHPLLLTTASPTPLLWQTKSTDDWQRNGGEAETGWIHTQQCPHVLIIERLKFGLAQMMVGQSVCISNAFSDPKNQQREEQKNKQWRKEWKNKPNQSRNIGASTRTHTHTRTNGWTQWMRWKRSFEHVLPLKQKHCGGGRQREPHNEHNLQERWTNNTRKEHKGLKVQLKQAEHRKITKNLTT